MYLITVKTMENNILTFKVKEYYIEKGFVLFTSREGLTKQFPIERCQIEEQAVKE